MIVVCATWESSAFSCLFGPKYLTDTLVILQIPTFWKRQLYIPSFKIGVMKSLYMQISHYAQLCSQTQWTVMSKIRLKLLYQVCISSTRTLYTVSRIFLLLGSTIAYTDRFYYSKRTYTAAACKTLERTGRIRRLSVIWMVDWFYRGSSLFSKRCLSLETNLSIVK